MGQLSLWFSKERSTRQFILANEFWREQKTSAKFDKSQIITKNPKQDSKM